MKKVYFDFLILGNFNTFSVRPAGFPSCRICNSAACSAFRPAGFVIRKHVPHSKCSYSPLPNYKFGRTEISPCGRNDGRFARKMEGCEAAALPPPHTPISSMACRHFDRREKSLMRQFELHPVNLHLGKVSKKEISL